MRAAPTLPPQLGRLGRLLWAGLSVLSGDPQGAGHRQWLCWHKTWGIFSEHAALSKNARPWAPSWVQVLVLALFHGDVGPCLPSPSVQLLARSKQRSMLAC